MEGQRDNELSKVTQLLLGVSEEFSKDAVSHH